MWLTWELFQSSKLLFISCDVTIGCKANVFLVEQMYTNDVAAIGALESMLKLKSSNLELLLKSSKPKPFGFLEFKTIYQQ